MYSKAHRRIDLPEALALLVEQKEAEEKAACTYDLSTVEFLPDDWKLRRNKYIKENLDK